MKTLAGLAFMLAASAAPLWAVWENATKEVQGTHVVIDNAQRKTTRLDLAPENPVTLTLKEKTSIRWKITAETDGVFSVLSDKVTIQSKALHKGPNSFKIFMEPGAYSFISSAKGLARCEIWRERKLASIDPEGGGYPVEMLIGGKKYTYYKAGADTVPVLKIKGPARVYVYFRAVLPEGAKKIEADLRVLENDSVVAHRVTTARGSKKASAGDAPATSISKAVIVFFKAPAGTHRYTIDAGKNKCFVKFYAQLRKKSMKAGTIEQGTIDRGMNIAPPADKEPAVAVVPPPVDKEPAKQHARKLPGATHRFRLLAVLGSGVGYGNNIYRYSGEFIDTFNLGLKDYRYPDVHGTGDFFFPFRIGTQARCHGFTGEVNAFADVYANNRQLNRRALSCALGWKGPFSLRAHYRYHPYAPVRPTYYAATSYRMLSYLSHEAGLRAGLPLPGRPWLGASVKRYDYNTTFDGYDALVLRAEAGCVLKKWATYELQLTGGGLKTDAPVPDADWSNRQGAVKAGLTLPRGPWSFGIDGSLGGMKYTTNDSADGHYHRNDILASASPSVSYTWYGLTVTTSVTYAYRNAGSPFESIEKQKDYGAMTGSVTFDWKRNLI